MLLQPPSRYLNSSRGIVSCPEDLKYAFEILFAGPTQMWGVAF